MRRPVTVSTKKVVPANGSYDKPHTQSARALRKRQSDAKRKLWSKLRTRGTGARFRHQQPLGKYMVDFICFEHKLVIEVEGGQHADPQRAAKEEIRANYITGEGYRLVRFWDNEVLTNIDGVVTRIMELTGTLEE